MQLENLFSFGGHAEGKWGVEQGGGGGQGPPLLSICDNDGLDEHCHACPDIRLIVRNRRDAAPWVQLQGVLSGVLCSSARVQVATCALCVKSRGRIAATPNLRLTNPTFLATEEGSP